MADSIDGASFSIDIMRIFLESTRILFSFEICKHSVVIELLFGEFMFVLVVYLVSTLGIILNQ